MTMPNSDKSWMELALTEANRAAEVGEVPVGAVLVKNNKVIGAGHNQTITNSDPSAHAEIVAMRRAGKMLGNYRLVETTLYVTLEPCPMCVGAIIHARLQRVVFAASDPKTGAAGGCFDLLTDHRHNQVPDLEHGLMAEESAALLRRFFKSRR